MAHEEQKNYCIKIKQQFPHFFKGNNVLDVGSLDINGNNRFLFENCSYLGIDVGDGLNVDLVSKTHEFDAPDNLYDVIISTECFEHDMYYNLSLINIVRMLSPGGLFIFTCATTGRPEHGTRRTTPADAPLLSNYDTWSDYYKNLTEQDIRDVIDINIVFEKYAFEIEPRANDLYFFGIKT